MDWLATPGINKQERNPISRNKTGDGENQVSNANVVKSLVDIQRRAFGGSTATEVDRRQDDRAIQTESIKGDLEICQDGLATSTID